MPSLINPVNSERSQNFGVLATAGVTGKQYGTTVQQLVFSYGNYQPFGHDGIDYACPIGTPVYAAAAGVVDFAGDGTHMPNSVALKWAFTTDPSAKWATGKAVLIDCGDGFGAYTAHMNSWVVQSGQRVKQGQLIGYSGITGRSGGPHCHFSVVEFAHAYSNGLYGRVNPDRFIGSASITPAGNITTPIQEDDDMATPEEIWSYRTTLRGQKEQAIDILRYANEFAADAKGQATEANHAAHRAEAKAEAAINAVAGLLSVQVPHPFEQGKTYPLVDYIRYGNAFAGQAADAAKAVMVNSDPKALAEAVAQAAGKVNAQTLIDQVKVTLEVKESK